MLEHQEVTQSDIDRALQSIQQKGVSASTKPVLQVNIDRIQKAQNGGFPMNMHHKTLEPRPAYNDAQLAMLMSQGYQEAYIPRHYPKWMHRRNLSPVFDPSVNPAKFDAAQNPAGVSDPFVESREVKTADAERALLAEKAGRDCSPWVDSVDKLPVVADSAQSEDDLRQQVAMLEGRIDEQRRMAAGGNAGETRRKSGQFPPTQPQTLRLPNLPPPLPPLARRSMGLAPRTPMHPPPPQAAPHLQVAQQELSQARQHQQACPPESRPQQAPPLASRLPPLETVLEAPLRLLAADTHPVLQHRLQPLLRVLQPLAHLLRLIQLSITTTSSKQISTVVAYPLGVIV